MSAGDLRFMAYLFSDEAKLVASIVEPLGRAWIETAPVDVLVTLTIDGPAYAMLRELEQDDDGYVNFDGTMWIGGRPVCVFRRAAQ